MKSLVALSVGLVVVALPVLAIAAPPAAAPAVAPADAITRSRAAIEELIQKRRLGYDLPYVVRTRVGTDLLAWRDAAGKKDAGGMCLLGMCNLYGIGGPANATRGRELILHAAETNDAESMAIWSVILRNGDLVNAPDADEANRWLGTAVAAGSKLAADMLPLAAAEELLAKGSVDEAIQTYLTQSKAGNLNATVALARVFQQGWLAKPQFDASIKLLERAAGQGHVKAMVRLGIARCDGFLTDRDIPAGRHLVEAAAATGDSESMMLAAEGYDLGALTDDGKPDQARAAAFWKQLKAAGDPVSAFDIAEHDFSTTSSDNPKYEKTVRPELIDAATRGEPRAYMYLSVMYRGGATSLGKDLKRSEALLDAGVAAGDANAMFQSACAMRSGYFGPANEDAARPLFFAAARLGMPKAMTSVALRFMTGRGVPLDARLGYFAYYAAAVNGDAEAMEAVATCLMSGRGVDRDVEAAEKWAWASVHWGHADAYDTLSRVAMLGLSPNAPYTTKARKMLEAGADAGGLFCARRLGYSLATGDQIDLDVARGVAMLERAEPSDDRGEVDVALGTLYMEGKHVPRDSNRALEYFKKSADRGNADGWAMMGLMHDGGHGLPLDTTEVLRCYQTGLSLGSEIATYNLGCASIAGKIVPKDAAKAVDYFRRSAESGNAGGAIALGQLLLTGDVGVEIDEKEALHWFTRAADLGDVDGIGRCAAYYRDKQDWIHERLWLERGEKMGDASCINDLGVQCRFGHGVLQDYAQAATYYRRSAEKGFATAMCNYAWCCETGNGVPKDAGEAFRWAMKAAALNEPSAMLNVGRYYMDGIGVPKDNEAGFRWIGKAADAGHPKAKAIMAAARAKGLVK